MAIYKPFSDIKPSVMVITLKTIGDLNKFPIFRLLHITRILNTSGNKIIDGRCCLIRHNTLGSYYIDYCPLNNLYNVDLMKLNMNYKTTKSKKKELPFYGIAGPIYHLSLGEHTRGIPRKRIFKNSITADMSIKNKSINMKISKNTIHICGLKNIDMAYEAFQIFKYNIDSIQKILDYIHSNMELSLNTLNWIKTVTKGNEYYVIEDTDYICPISDIEIKKGITIVSPTSKTFQLLLFYSTASSINKKIENHQDLQVSLIHSIFMPNEIYIPDNCDPAIADFLFDKALDEYCYEIYCKNLDWIMTQTKLYDTELTLCGILYNNINYSYNIGKLNRIKLRNYINTTDILRAEFTKSISTYVTIYLKFEIPENLQNEIRRNEKNDTNYHKFIIYKTGAVTQSGPHPILNEIAYNTFMKIIEKGKHLFSK